MPVVHLFSDHLGRPVIEVAISIGTTRRVTQPEEATFPPRTVQALIDTGAGRSHVDLEILKSLQLKPVEKVEIFTASTGSRPEPMSVYLVDLLWVGDHPGLLAQDLRVIVSDKLAGLQVDMLLGRDVLERCLLIYDGINRRVSLAYNPPSSPS